MAAYSATGPTRDGRIKPDIVATGDFIISAKTDGATDTYQCGVDPGRSVPTNRPQLRRL